MKNVVLLLLRNYLLLLLLRNAPLTSEIVKRANGAFELEVIGGVVGAIVTTGTHLTTVRCRVGDAVVAGWTSFTQGLVGEVLKGAWWGWGLGSEGLYGRRGVRRMMRRRSVGVMVPGDEGTWECGCAGAWIRGIL